MDSSAPSPTNRSYRLANTAVGVALALLVLAGIGGIGWAWLAGHRSAPAKPISPAALVARSRAELEKAQSVHLVAVSATGARLEFSIQDAGTAEAQQSKDPRYPGMSLSVIYADGRTYAKANAAYLKKYAPAAAAWAADRWILTAQSYVKTAKQLQPVLDVPKDANCLLAHRGHLRLGPDTTVAGVPVHEVIDAGGAPGTTPARLYFAAIGPPDLVRIVTTGLTAPGSDSSCEGRINDFAHNRSELGTYDFDHWGGVVQVGVPAEVIQPAG